MDQEDRVRPTLRQPPTGLNTRAVCEQLGWTMRALFRRIERGELPAPDWWAGEMVWPAKYVWFVQRYGPSLPGTYEGWIPGTDVAAELRRWERVPSGGKTVRYTAKGTRACKKAAKKGGQK